MSLSLSESALAQNSRYLQLFIECNDNDTFIACWQLHIPPAQPPSTKMCNQGRAIVLSAARVAIVIFTGFFVDVPVSRWGVDRAAVSYTAGEKIWLAICRELSCRGFRLRWRKLLGWVYDCGHGCCHRLLKVMIGSKVWLGPKSSVNEEPYYFLSIDHIIYKYVEKKLWRGQIAVPLVTARSQLL